MKIFELEELLGVFEQIPKPNLDSTFMEVCSYPRSRFEEICSRILAFYLQPKNEHGLGDLLISTFLELISKEKINYSKNQIIVLTEEDSKGKRLDLLIHSPDFHNWD